jgi:hypothetical protein
MADSDARTELEAAKAEISRLQAENVTLRMKVCVKQFIAAMWRI